LALEAPVAAAEVGETEPESSAPSQSALTNYLDNHVSVDQVLAILQRAQAGLGIGEFGPQVATRALQVALLLTNYTEQQLVDDPQIFPATQQWQLEEEQVEVLTSVTVSGIEIELGKITWEEVSFSATVLAGMMEPGAAFGAPVKITWPGQEDEENPFGADSTVELLRALVQKFGKSTDGYVNGHLPQDVLCPLEFNAAHQARCDAAGTLAALNRAYLAQFGVELPITSSYRPFSVQVQVALSRPHLAATPGRSMHGWGLAIDFGHPISSGLTEEYRWLAANGPKFGWENPSWARLTGSKPEPWHFEFTAVSRPADFILPPRTYGFEAGTSFATMMYSAFPTFVPKPKLPATSAAVVVEPKTNAEEPKKPVTQEQPNQAKPEIPDVKDPVAEEPTPPAAKPEDEETLVAPKPEIPSGEPGPDEAPEPEPGEVDSVAQVGVAGNEMS
jgi:hypothetical protein